MILVRHLRDWAFLGYEPIGGYMDLCIAFFILFFYYSILLRHIILDVSGIIIGCRYNKTNPVSNQNRISDQNVSRTIAYNYHGTRALPMYLPIL